MGTELERRGVQLDLPLWSARALIEKSERVLEIHRDYAKAGADVLTTNTFRTHRRTLAKAGISDKARTLTQLAVKLAKEASDGQKVAGSIAPLEDCWRPELSPGSADDEFREIAETLVESGVDFLLIETMNNTAEARSAIRAAQKTGASFWLSMTPNLNDATRILNGEPLREGVSIAMGEGAEAFLVNCAAMEVIEAAVEHIRGAPLPIGGYANNAHKNETWSFERELPYAEFAEHGERLADLGAAIIGGCCGTTPEHIHAFAEGLRKDG